MKNKILLVALLATVCFADGSGFVASDYVDYFHGSFNDEGVVLISLDRDVIREYGGEVTIPNITVIAGYHTWSGKDVILRRFSMSPVTMTEIYNFFTLYIPEIAAPYGGAHVFANCYQDGMYFADP